MTDKQKDDWDDVDVDEEDTAEDTEGWDDETDPNEDTEAEPEVELDPEDPLKFPTQYYTVQVPYQQDDQTIEAGTDIEIKCGNCAAWDAPLKARGNKPLCKPGAPCVLPASDGQEPKHWRMQDDRYSCQTHFIPKDMEDVLTHLTDDPDQVRMLLWAFPAIAQFVKLQQRIRQFHAKRGGDPEKSIDNVLDFMQLFNSAQQQELVRPFIKRVVDGLSQSRKKKPGPSRTAFRSGDSVTWEIQPGKSVEGFILSIGGRGKCVTIMVHGESVRALAPDGEHSGSIQWKRPVEEWKKMNPKLIASAPLVNQ